MRWEAERYVRIYTRDTVNWLSLSFEAQALWMLVLRKLDRVGRLALGKHGNRAVAIAIGHPERQEQVLAALKELLEDGCLVVDGEELFAPNYEEAQEVTATNADRQQRYRDRKRTASLEEPTIQVTVSEESVTNVTPVTRYNTVTPNQPYLTSLTSQPEKKKVPHVSLIAETLALAPPVPVTAFGEFCRSHWPDMKAPEEYEQRAHAAFPAVDVLAEALKAHGWEQSEATHRKRKHGKFFWSWLTSAQDGANRKNGYAKKTESVMRPPSPPEAFRNEVF